MNDASTGTAQIAPDEMLRIAAEVTSSLNLNDSLKAACQAAVRLLGCDHSGLAIFDSSLSYGVVRGEHPGSIGAIGSRIQIHGVPAEEKLVRTKEPLFIEDVRAAKDLGPVRDILLRMEVWSLLLVPILSHDRIIGSFSIDFIRRQTAFSEDAQRVCNGLARLVAAAIENASTYQTMELVGTRAANDAKLLDTLEEHSSHLVAQKEPTKLLQETVRLATELFPGLIGHIFERHQDTGHYHLAFVSGLPAPPTPIMLPYSDPILTELRSSSKCRVFPSGSSWSESFSSFISPGYVLCTPLRVRESIEAILFLQDPMGMFLSQERNLDVLRRFFARAESAIELAHLVSPDQRASARIAVFEVITGYILRARDPERIYNAFLTGVTADYGLGLNRAALFLFEDCEKKLKGVCAIGEIAAEAAWGAWRSFHRDANDFTSYVSQLERGTAPVSTLGLTIRSCVLERSDLSARPLFEAADTRTPVQIPVSRLKTLPTCFVECYHPNSVLLSVPLIAEERVLGVVLADNRFTHSPITAEDERLLKSLSKTTALVLDNLAQYSEIRTHQERLRSLYEASNRLHISSNAQEVGDNIASQALHATGAAGVTVMIISENGNCESRYSAGQEDQLEKESFLRPSDLSMQVLRTGTPLIVEDAERQVGIQVSKMLRKHSRAAICLQMTTQGSRIGVMWFRYSDIKQFSSGEVESLQYFANQAAITYWSSIKLNDMDWQFMAGNRSPETMSEAYELIAGHACEMFSAAAAIITPYDARRERFILNETVGVGLDSADLKTDSAVFPAPESILNEALRGKDVAVFESTLRVRDDGERQPKLVPNPATQKAIALRADLEPIAVLRLIYTGGSDFVPNQERLLEFAKHTGALLKTARTHRNLVAARRAGHRAARMAAAGRYDETLREIARSAIDTLFSDAVVLYGYNPETEEFFYPPTCEGLRDQAAAQRFPVLPSDSWIREFLGLEKILPIHKVEEDDRFRDREFASREGVKSLVLVSLRSAETAVGLMFVNYRYLHEMTVHELEDLQLFADHAAVAIRTALFIEEQQKRLHDLQEVDRKKTEYLATISHELRTPLTPLQAIIDALLDGTYGFVSEKQREKLGQALERAHEESRLIDNLLDLVRIESGKVQLNLTSVSLAQVLRGIMKVFEYSASKKGVVLSLDLPSKDRLKCFVDRTKITHVITNLVDNAIKFTESGGSVKISAQRQTTQFIVSVADTGEGIEEADQERIFDRFQQVGRGGNRERGLGVGLHIVRDWVKEHGGEVYVRSKAAEGAVFWFTLPWQSDRELRA